MRQSIAPFDTPERRELYRTGKVHKAAVTKDMNKRYRWDLFFIGEGHRRPHEPTVKWMCDVLYTYLNDDHIDTALRSIVKPLEAA